MRPSNTVWLVSVLLTVFCLLSRGAGAQSPDQAALRAGVKEIAAPGLPGPLCVYGPRAFPVIVGKVGKDLYAPVVAAARLDRGRVVAFGHPGYLEAEALNTADTGRLVRNAVQWLGGRKASPEASPLRIGVRRLPGLRAFLEKQGLPVQALDGADWQNRLHSLDMLACPVDALSDPEIRALDAYLRDGGGLLAADLGWGWLQLHPGKDLTQHGGSRLLGPAGLLWADGTLERTAPHGYDATLAPPAFCQATEALAAVVALSEHPNVSPSAGMGQAAWTLSTAAQTLPPSDTLLLPALQRLEKQHQADLANAWQKPITTGEPLLRLLVTLQLQEMRRLPAERVRPSPAADRFPGPVPADAPRVDRTLPVDTAVPAWHSTGLYAAPGEIITVDIPQEAVGKRLRVRIGAHTDTLWHLPTWERAPEITRDFALASLHTQAANAFGGPIYVEVPPDCRLGTLAVTVHRAVEAPYFVRGHTDLTAWRDKLRQLPAPWAELQGEHVILTVPASAVRHLDDPDALMAYWDDVYTHCAALYQAPPRDRPERYCVDRQISAGYMHSGYPIMTGSDVADRFTDLAVLRGQDGRPNWGFYHELGHNFQVGDWTFEGTGEVTNNLNSLYCCEQLNGIPSEDYTRAHGALAPHAMQVRLQKYLANGANFEDWKRDPFLALTLYIQLRRAFGWAAFQKVFTEYRALPESQRPKTDLEKHDQWMTRFSRAVGKDLGSFFEAWGIPTSDRARHELTDLPTWMPPDFPTR